MLTLLLTLLVLISLYSYFRRWHSYWPRHHLPHLPPSIPFGNLLQSSQSQVGLVLADFYRRIKANKWRHAGLYFFHQPVYVPADPDLYKLILTQDFGAFTDRGAYYNEKCDPLSAHLFNLRNPKWGGMRSKLSPTFTSGKLKTTLPLMVECLKPLIEQMEAQCGQAVNIKEVLQCFTTDVIGSCAFGLDCQSFEAKNSPFRHFGAKVFERTRIKVLKRAITNIWPGLAHLLRFRVISEDVERFFTDLITETVQSRTCGTKRRDFLQLLIDLPKDDALTLTEITAQALLFFLAGFETSSTCMTFTLYELARNQPIQARLRLEIVETLAKYNGKVTYEALNEMTYLTQVIMESLRLYPPFAAISRKAVVDYTVPGTEVVISKGTLVFIPVYGVHHDEEFYPKAEKFDPERFSDEGKKERHPYAFLGFGQGPRNCVGARFGLMQVKVGLIALLSRFIFKINGKTKEPLQMDGKNFILSAIGGVWLDVSAVNQ